MRRSCAKWIWLPTLIQMEQQPQLHPEWRRRGIEEAGRRDDMPRLRRDGGESVVDGGVSAAGHARRVGLGVFRGLGPPRGWTMTTVLTFAYAVWCATAPQVGTYLADGTVPAIERQTVTRRSVQGPYQEPAGCVLTWDGWQPDLNAWCLWLGDRVCQVVVVP